MSIQYNREKCQRIFIWKNDCVVLNEEWVSALIQRVSLADTCMVKSMCQDTIDAWYTPITTSC